MPHLSGWAGVVMGIEIPAARRRAQCVLWLSGQCRYAAECACHQAALADEAASEAAKTVIPPARRPPR
jgi:hypothetical protein